MISLATWNVNSVKARLAHLLGWLKESAPDIVLLQELKCTDDAFPYLEIEELGYNIAVHGEKTYNGVAILSKFPLEDVRKGLPGDSEDSHARYIEAVVSLGRRQEAGVKSGSSLEPLASSLLPTGVIRVASVYVPNGQTPDSDKFAYKLRFYERLRAHAGELLRLEEMLAIGGDYNVAPYDVDVHDPAEWANTVLCHPHTREQLRALLHMGLYDAFPSAHRQPSTVNRYTWWDYRAGALAADDGLRIDHLLLSPQAADVLQDCVVVKQLRTLDKPSDHAPVMATLAV